MAPERHDTNPPGGYDENDPNNASRNTGNGPVPANSGTAQTNAGRGQRAITNVAVCDVATVAMTAREYGDAVEALAVLIARWERDQPPTSPAASPAGIACEGGPPHGSHH